MLHAASNLSPSPGCPPVTCHPRPDALGSGAPSLTSGKHRYYWWLLVLMATLILNPMPPPTSCGYVGEGRGDSGWTFEIRRERGEAL